jgi:threonine/homoserine/homoserine lactone efflux protein
MEFFFKGIGLGFAIAAPVGPIGLLCIQRTLNAGLLIGLVSGLGAATADALYGFVAAFLVGQRFWLAIGGGLFLLWLGVSTLRAEPASVEASAQGGVAPASLLAAYGSTLLLTITNPMTILAFVAIFAGAGLAGSTGGDTSASAWLVAGVFVGSAAWWLLLSGGVSLLRERIDAGAMRWINRGAGGVIVAFALYALWSAFAGG